MKRYSVASYPLLKRRQLLLGIPASSLLASLPAWAQTNKALGANGGLEVVQIVDSSPTQLDVSRDFLIGSRAAWQELNSHGGVRGRPVQHTVIEVDGSQAALRQALNQARALPNCVALSGTCGDRTASQLSQLLKQEAVELAHVAPWLHDDQAASPDRTFAIFASQREQISHTLKSLSVMGVSELGVIYASAQEQTLYQTSITAIASELKLQTVAYTPKSTLAQLGQQLTPRTPAMLLFVGGTPELAQFTQGLEKQDRQRYVVGLADINLQTLKQLGTSRSTPVIATQVVPMVTSGVPIVRSYRETLSRLFDEPPNPLSLSGYVAARYTQSVLQQTQAGASRAQVLQTFQKLSSLDVGGFKVTFQAQRRVGAYVTQSMLGADGHIIG